MRGAVCGALYHLAAHPTIDPLTVLCNAATKTSRGQSTEEVNICPGRRRGMVLVGSLCFLPLAFTHQTLLPAKVVQPESVVMLLSEARAVQKL